MLSPPFKNLIKNSGAQLRRPRPYLSTTVIQINGIQNCWTGGDAIPHWNNYSIFYETSKISHYRLPRSRMVQ